MKRILIIQPHWPPSNLVGIHRVRLVANQMHQFGWSATILAVDSRDYEEELIPELERLVHPSVEVVKVRAHPIIHCFGKRMIGDISLRGWKALKIKADEILERENFSFIWFSLPPWYACLMGHSLSKKHQVQFGIDYRDPWVYKLPDDTRFFSRAKATILASRLLEPIALRGVSLISGVSKPYIQGVIDRNRQLKKVPCITFQNGLDYADHFIELDDFQFPSRRGKRTYVYAGAHWLMGAPLFSLFLRAVQRWDEINEACDFEFLFIGTHNPEIPSISQQAKDLGITHVIREIPHRLSFLQVQQILRESSGAIVIGSVEPHYSASKIFQCLITAPRVMGFFHEASEGSSILIECHADSFFVPYNPNVSEEELIDHIASTISKFTNPNQPWDPDLSPLDAHTSARNAQKFLAAVEQIIR
jgi:hypothetical protein